ncbi:MAG: DUF805 domain-containing protein [Bacteroidota bacterium]
MTVRRLSIIGVHQRRYRYGMEQTGFPGHNAGSQKHPPPMFFWYREVLYKYADFSGRARRREYWMFTLANVAIVLPLLVVGVILSSLLTEAHAAFVFSGMYALYALYILATLIPQLAVSVRRLHDTGKSGWWMLLAMVPLGSWVLLFFFVQEGDDRDNAYGADPKGFADLSARVDDLARDSFYSENIYAQSARSRAI